MLRILIFSSSLWLGVCAGLFSTVAAWAQNESRNENENTESVTALPSAGNAADAAAAARTVMQRATELQQQPEFQEQIRKERQAMAGLVGQTVLKPGTDLGAPIERPPSPATTTVRTK